MRRISRKLTIFSTMAIATIMSLAVSAANAQEVAAQVIGKVN